MALETVFLVADQTWQLISNSGAGRFAARVLNGTEVLFSIGTAAPAAGSVLGFPAGELRFDNLDGKVWVRTTGDNTIVSVVRVVDAGNPALTMLRGLALSTTSFTAGAVPGTVLATIANRTPGSTIKVTPNDGRFVITDDGTTARLVAGLTATSQSPAIPITLVETHAKAPNSPSRSEFVLSAGSGVVPVPAYKLTRGAASQTFSATQVGIFAVPTRLLSIEVVSVSGGTATIYANSANTGTTIAVVNTVGKLDIPGGYLSFLGIGIAITGTISVRLTWETVTEGTTTDEITSYDEGLCSTIVLTASRAKTRTQPCEVAGIFCMSSGGGSAILYDNEANSGAQIYNGSPAANQVIDFDPDAFCYRGLSAALSGTLSLAVQVR